MYRHLALFNWRVAEISALKLERGQTGTCYYECRQMLRIADHEKYKKDGLEHKPRCPIRILLSDEIAEYERYIGSDIV